MVNRQKLFTTLANFSLGSEKVFGRGFVTDERIYRNIPGAIDCLSSAIGSAANQAAAFVGSGLTRMRDDFAKMIVVQLKDHGWRTNRICRIN